MAKKGKQAKGGKGGKPMAAPAPKSVNPFVKRAAAARASARGC